MHEHLQPWYDKWLSEHVDTSLRFAVNVGGKPTLHQVHFVRDHLAGVFWRGVPYDQRKIAHPRECRESAYVIGEHTSKSVRLPVYSLERADLGIQIVLRDNYHDWNVSVVSERAIDAGALRGFPLDYASDEERARFPNGYKPGRSWDYCHFQGFPERLQFGLHKENPRKFSMCVGGEYSVYTLVWLLMREIRGG